ncbi:MAG TPA: glutathione peroxidase [Abditibacteriaceae bacterium]|nr:glutathione peroxidase [Abditibacteriaceae bacterium]
MTEGKEVPAVLDFKMPALDGRDVDLAQYQGKVVLVVNVASQCGYTPQYKGLQELHEKYATQGLAVLGFPANDFGQQEPGSAAEISQFCQVHYGVDFDMFSKVTVAGDDKCDLYRYLTAEATNPQSPGEVKWNFEKFLIGRDGHIAARFASRVTPESEAMVQAIESELAKP